VLYLSGSVGSREALKAIASPAALAWGAFTGVFFYWLVAAVDSALRFRGRYAALESELNRSKLDALRSQLRPHFLFNTLNAISGLVPQGDKAHRMLLRLSSLLRRSLDEDSHEVPLQTELTFLNDYLDIQRVRFGDQLVIDVDMEPSALVARVPVFLLQPLLENAIEYGESDDGHTTIRLSARREGDQLVIRVEDDGPGIRPDLLEKVQEPFFSTKSGGTGLGLAICRALAWQNGGRLEIGSLPGEGTRVTMEMRLASDGTRDEAPVEPVGVLR